MVTIISYDVPAARDLLWTPYWKMTFLNVDFFSDEKDVTHLVNLFTNKCKKFPKTV